jgi:16S rRNA (guanine(966)-N(2))-methyltransferase RsmD
MRIIGGTFKGRRFSPPANNWPTRPTTDYAKEGLYNILTNEIDFEETKFLDLFGGTGNHCYEMVSRGCIDVTYVEKYPSCIKFVSETINKLGIASNVTIVRQDVFKFIAQTTMVFDCIFADPPYALRTIGQIPDLVLENRLLSENGLLIVEHDGRVSFEKHKNFKKARNYGQTIFSFFQS